MMQNGNTNTPTGRKVTGKYDARSPSDVNGGGVRVALPLKLPYHPKPTSAGGESSGSTSNGKPNWSGPTPIAGSSSSAGNPFYKNPDSEPASPATTELRPLAAKFEPTQKPSLAAMLNEDSEPIIADSSAVHPSKTNGKGKAPIGSGSSRTISPIPAAHFSTDIGPGHPYLGTHYIRIENIKPNAYENSMNYLFNKVGWAGKVMDDGQTSTNDSTGELTLYLCFDSLEDGNAAIDEAGALNTTWTVLPIIQTEYARVKNAPGLSFWDGQVVFKATFRGSIQEAHLSLDGLTEAVHALAKSFGAVLAFTYGAKSNNRMNFRVEFYKLSDAKEALSQVSTKYAHHFEDWDIVAEPYMGSCPSGSAPASTMPSVPGTPRVTVRVENGREIYESPTGRTCWSYNEDGKLITELPKKTLPKVGVAPPTELDTPTRDRYNSAPAPNTQSFFGGGYIVYQPRSGSWAAGDGAQVTSSRNPTADTEPQAVNIGRITIGQDVRTTIMLRNLPNKWTASDLKTILDATSHGKYDFSYLRIDFMHNTNVGYAFVNFTDAVHILPFVRAYIGHEWQPGSYPRKTAQVSYATVQGYDCLVEKFRNSSIMDEYSEYRPKLWYTDDTAPNPSKIGKERPFPEPNNMSKKNRSSDNAGQIGLYAPRSGQRGGDRMRRSNYDRGTPHQIQEDTAYYNQMSPVSPGFGFNDGHYVHGPRAPIGAPPPAFSPFGNYAFQPMSLPYHNASGPIGFQMGPNGMPDPFTPPFAQPLFSPHAGYPMPGYGPRIPVNNPASMLRTQSKGQIAGRPKNVVVAQNGYFGGPVQQPNHDHVPRTFAGNDEQQDGFYGSIDGRINGQDAKYDYQYAEHN